MAIKNYYLILGVSRGESQEGIRAAFRQLAKRYHPDRAGSESAAEFREILEAYEVLSDPERRRHYNSELEAAERTAGAGASGEPAPSWSRQVWEEFAARLAAGSRPARVVAFDVVLHPEEASLGTTLPIDLPFSSPCPACGSRGTLWLFPCSLCGGEGARLTLRRLWIEIPPRTRHGAVLELPYPAAGPGGILLRVRVRVAAY